MTTNQPIKLNNVIIYTDGSCNTHTRIGGWACNINVATSKGNTTKLMSGAQHNTTSNRMELLAVEQGITALKWACNITIYTDSADLIGWMSKTMKRKNAEIALMCERIEQYAEKNGHKLTFVKVDAHASDENNNLVDKIAVQARKDEEAKQTKPAWLEPALS
jgi:ribonuclease HI